MLSPTYGEANMEQVAERICQRVCSRPGDYNLLIGTDSQNFDTTKVVVVIALHQVGSGGIFFYDITRIRLIRNIGQKLLYETQLSLQYAGELVQALDALKERTGFDYEQLLNLSIHVDAGENGDSRKSIPEIVGWITSCGYRAVVKPDSIAACSIANKFSK